MSLTTTTPVGALEGIGETLTALLGKFGIATVLDLLRHTNSEIHAAVQSAASRDQARRWRAMAVLMQAANVDCQLAEALVKKNVTTLGELGRTKLAAAQVIFEEAKGNNIIPDVPNADTIASILVDATRLHCCGCLSGRVVDREEEPGLDVAVVMGHLRARCDSSGRFRLLGIPLDWTAPLLCEWGEGKVHPFNEPGFSRNVGSLVEIEFKLPFSWADAPQETEELSELTGDKMPVFRGVSFQVVEKPRIEIREGDLLVVNHIYERTPEVKLTSRLRICRSGKILVLAYRVALNELPEDARLGDGFEVRDGAFKRFKATPRRIENYKAQLRVQKRFSGLPRPANHSEMKKRFLAFNRAVLEELPGTRKIRLL